MSSNLPVVQPGTLPAGGAAIESDRIRQIWREIKKVPPIGSVWGFVRASLFQLRDLKERLSYLPKHVEIRRHQWTKLQLGAGGNALAGWLNTDLRVGREVLKVDATRPLLFAHGSFRYVFSEHMIEHVSLEDARRMLSEVQRVLRDGGKVRVSTPDFDFFLGLFRENLTAEEREFVRWHVNRYNPGYPIGPLSVMNTMFRSWGHKHLYNEETLSLLLRECGFEDIKRFPTGDSDDPELRGLESHGQLVGESNNRMETLVLEATKCSLCTAKGGA